MPMKGQKETHMTTSFVESMNSIMKGFDPYRLLLWLKSHLKE